MSLGTTRVRPKVAALHRPAQGWASRSTRAASSWSSRKATDDRRPKLRRLVRYATYYVAQREPSRRTMAISSIQRVEKSASLRDQIGESLSAAIISGELAPRSEERRVGKKCVSREVRD